MKKTLQFLACAVAFALLFAVYGYGQTPQNVQKLSGALTAGFTVPSGVSIAATGTGTIAATSVAGFSRASGKVLTLSNTLTFTGTDSSSVNFGAGGTVAYTASSVASITGTANQITASASTGAVTLSLPTAVAGVNSFTSATGQDLTIATLDTDKDIFLRPNGAGSVKAILSGASPASSWTPFPTSVGAYNEGDDGNDVLIAHASNTASIGGAVFGRRARGTLASPTVVASGDRVFAFLGSGYDGATFRNTAALSFDVDGTVASNQVPQSITLSTSLNGTGSRISRLLISNAGRATWTASNVSLASWGTTGAVSNWNGPTVTDPGSSGTVASAVAHSLAVPTFAATTTTTFTNAATLYIAGSVAAGTNVTLTNSWGLWNVGRTFLNNTTSATTTITGALVIGNGTSTNTNIGMGGGSIYAGSSMQAGVGLAGSSPNIAVNGPNTDYGGFLLIHNGTNKWVMGWGGLSADTLVWRSQVSNANRMTLTEPGNLAVTGASHTFGTAGTSTTMTVGQGATGTDSATLVLSSGNNTFPVSQISFAHNGSVTGALLTNTDRFYIGHAGGFNFRDAPTSGSVHTRVAYAGSPFRALATLQSAITTTAWGVTGPGFSTGTVTLTDSNSSGTVATAVANSFGVPTFAASSVTTYTAAATLYIAGDVAAGTNVTLTASYGLWNVGKTRLDGIVTLGGGATLVTTRTALTDGAGASVATFTNAPSAGNPTKWIGINDNGTTRYVPAW